MRLSGCWPQPRRGRWTSSSAPGWTCCARRSRSPRAWERCSAAAAEGREAARAARPRAGARDLPGRVGAAAFAGRLGAAAICWKSRRAAQGAPAATHPPRPVDLLLDGLALLITEGRAAAAPTLQRAASVFAAKTCPSKKLRGAGWPRRPADAMWDNERLGGGLRTADPARPGRRSPREGCRSIWSRWAWPPLEW